MDGFLWIYVLFNQRVKQKKTKHIQQNSKIGYAHIQNDKHSEFMNSKIRSVHLLLFHLLVTSFHRMYQIVPFSH